MKKTLPMMAKAALVTLLAWGGLAQAKAQGNRVNAQGNRVNIVEPQNYENVTASDWTYTGSQTNKNNRPLFKSSLVSSGSSPYYKYVSNKSKEATNPASFKKGITFLDGKNVKDGYVDANMTEKGYVIEFDFQIYNWQYNNDKSASELIVATQEPTADTYYSGSDYVFALSVGSLNYSGFSNDDWHINDLTNSNTTTTLDESWYHLKLVITNGNCAYYISSNGTDVYTGNRTVSGIPQVNCIWNLVENGGTDGYLYFDNFEVYHYEADESTREATTPTIAWKETTENSVKYTITFKDGEVLHYKLPNQSAYTEVSDGTSTEVEVTEGGTLEAYTTYYNDKATPATTTTSSTTTEEVKIFTVDISTESGLCSFSGAKDAYTRVPDDVAIYQVTVPDNQDGNQELNTTKAVLRKVTGFQSSMQFINANAGVFLYKEGGGKVTLPFVPEEGINQKDVDLYSDNQLRGTCDDAKTVPEKEGQEGVTVGSSVTYYYFCLKKHETALARVKVDVEIPEHKAYLKILSTAFSSSGNANLSLVFEDDDATGIDGVKNEKGDAGNQGALYNLAGQRVDDTYKGLVVQNGRKYLKK